MGTEAPKLHSQMSRAEILQKAYNLGFEYESTNRGCAQCVLGAIQDLFGLPGEVFKAGSALSAGMCVTGAGPCGALSGAVIAIGYYYGRDREHFPMNDRARHASQFGRNLWQKFEEEYGSVLCKDVQTRLMGRSFNLLDTEDRKAFDEAGGHSDKCPSVVGNAARWLAEILLDNPPENR
ncbi:MAG: C-GCAxxG-C-C family protein [Ignavibacteriales bacterium]